MEVIKIQKIAKKNRIRYGRVLKPVAKVARMQ